MDDYDVCVLHRGHPCEVLLNTPLLSSSRPVPARARTSYRDIDCGIIIPQTGDGLECAAATRTFFTIYGNFQFIWTESLQH
jgi:hypothetical protein